ncbi:MAG: hypothetical protein OEY94_10875 [Alphaproteobacteria bacterium]|nr:hypothetical protein [Alphaproteobacteria bacterium]
MHNAVKKLIDYMYQDNDAMQYHGLAMQTVFGDLAEENGLNDINDLNDFFGSETFWMIYPVMLEFFFTNVYGQNGDWNIIDSFLTYPKNSLTKDERVYLSALRPSVMSVYEVTAIEPEKSLTVRDMIRGGEPVKIKEKSLTRYVSQWECLGMRILDMGDHLEFAGGVLRLERGVAEELAPWLKEMRDMTVAMFPLHDTSIPREKISHFAEVLWAPEIALAWIECLIESKDRNTPQIHNKEGHAISPVTICFPITKNHGDIAAFFNKHREFQSERSGEWVWLKKERGEKNKKLSYTVRGDIVLHADHLELFVNSRERANILEDIVSKGLVGIIGKPRWKYTDAPSASVKSFLEGLKAREVCSDENEENISQEEMQALIMEMKDDHYHQWLSSRIPALEDKTPRMAKRSKKGQNQLVSLLKDMENHENHQAKAQGMKPYDMTWIWEELGLDRNIA